MLSQWAYWPGSRAGRARLRLLGRLQNIVHRAVVLQSSGRLKICRQVRLSPKEAPGLALRFATRGGGGGGGRGF